jgi:hypothetical protein
MDDVVIKLFGPGAVMAHAGLRAIRRGGPPAASNAFNQNLLRGRG